MAALLILNMTTVRSQNDKVMVFGRKVRACHRRSPRRAAAGIAEDRKGQRDASD
jgi:hypothetical protein